MFTSTTSTPHPAHPLPLRDQAFALYCDGLRSPAIAQQLHVPERTVRAWIAATQQALTDERTGTAQTAAALAEARQLRIAAAAWDGYRRLAAAEQQQVDDLQYGTHDELAANAPRLTGAGARYLALALRATDLAAKLAGAYTCPPPQPACVDFHMLIDKPGPECYEPPFDPKVPPLTGLALEQYQHQMFVGSRAGQIEADLKQLDKARARLAEINALLSPPPTDQDDLDDNALHDAYDAAQQDSGNGDGDEDEDHDTAVAGDPAAPTAVIPAEPATSSTGGGDFPAESATSDTGERDVPPESAPPPSPPYLSVSSVSSVSSVVRSESPAESATTLDSLRDPSCSP